MNKVALALVGAVMVVIAPVICFQWGIDFATNDSLHWFLRYYTGGFLLLAGVAEFIIGAALIGISFND
jgi:hypothetical protein